MSKLAAKLPTADQIPDQRIRKGPNGACDVYGEGDLEDFEAVDALRKSKSWSVAQQVVDNTAGVKPIDPNKFRYHWNAKCWHWPPETKALIEARRHETQSK